MGVCRSNRNVPGRASAEASLRGSVRPQSRHFCASWLFNDLELPAQDVAHQLGHTDGGALVQRLYGHPSERLARERIKWATGGKLAPVTELREAERRQGA